MSFPAADGQGVSGARQYWLTQRSVLWPLLRLCADLLTFRASRRRLSIFVYHGVWAKDDVCRDEAIQVEQFDWQMRLLSRVFNIIPLQQAVEAMKTGTLPKRAVVLTFDDGYENNLSVALPVLQKYQVPATFFITACAVQQGIMWNDLVKEAVYRCGKPVVDLSGLGLGQVSIASANDKTQLVERLLEQLKALRLTQQQHAVALICQQTGVQPNRRLMLTEQQLKQFANTPGVTVGCHTYSHPMLSVCSQDEVLADLQASKAYLQSITGAPVDYFAYPYGKYGQHFFAEHVNLVVQSGFKAAVTTDWGVNEPEDSFYLLKRFTPWDSNPVKFFLRMCLNYRKA
ncbi:polysaccharide deacetylase family protein [Rheinheimera sp.]|uniref:polysaccharide deacetylase family protein n=1 Tax=Rheinheimera sp. TaxID=1869214 RepID=UPI00404726EA